jgi:glycosyl transferase, family 25
VINLERSKDRLDHMTKQLDRVGLPWERVPAVDAQDPEVKSLAEECPPSRFGPRLGLGPYGNIQSHRECWRRLIASDDAHGIILEDDVLVADGTGGYQDASWIPPDADLVRLETYGSVIEVDRGEGLVAGLRRLKRLRSLEFGTAGYVISRRAAQRLLAFTETIRDPTDHVLFNPQMGIAGWLTIYQMIPAPVVQLDRAPSESVSGRVLSRAITELWQAHDTRIAIQDDAKPGYVQRMRTALGNKWRGWCRGTESIVVPFG